MKDSFFKKLLEKYSNGTANGAERFIVDAWYDSFDKDSKKSIPGISNMEETEMTRLRIFNKTAPQVPKQPWFRNPWMQAAALLTVISGVSLGYLQHRLQEKEVVNSQITQTYQTGRKEIKKILLKDSTVIWLNANSSIRLPTDFGTKERRLTLMGEANFEVQRDSLKPFIVDAREISIRVLGTAFNVNAYQQFQRIKVSVGHGKVQVNEGQTTLALLTKGQGLEFSKTTHQFEVKSIMSSNSTAWISGLTVLEKASFQEVQQAMLNVYGVKISTKDKKVKAYKYNITLRSNQSRENALDMLMTIVNKKYSQEEPNEIEIY
ncbi:hypothetical protein DBR43_03620 [Pedobacter sp. KBW06]|uniref:FecR family protein n=1 Tax=Pedobacter sp. KBW06 TaxID=2153359 RepID=UPI000F5929FB|nr:FecR family protein [Pedobacter sp. KBW06]RQO74491.1 hypothetical protein DBR43_03620 [Pedobacter sp. KBW06]